MRMYLLSDNVDTVTGFRLSGILGEVIHEKEALEEALKRVYKQEDLAILLITEKLASLSPALIKDIKLDRHKPLLVEIPDRHGMLHAEDYITAYVKNSIGLKLG